MSTLKHTHSSCKPASAKRHTHHQTKILSKSRTEEGSQKVHYMSTEIRKRCSLQHQAYERILSNPKNAVVILHGIHVLTVTTPGKGLSHKLQCRCCSRCKYALVFPSRRITEVQNLWRPSWMSIPDEQTYLSDCKMNKKPVSCNLNWGIISMSLSPIPSPGNARGQE